MKVIASDTFYKFLQKILSVFNFIALGAIKAYLNTQIGQGTLKKVVNWLADNAYDQTVGPILQVLIVRVGYSYDVHQGKVLIEKLKEARESGNEDEYDSTVDVILS